MSFFKKIFKSDPYKKLQERILDFKWPEKAINLFTEFENFDEEVITKVVVDQIIANELNQGFIGTKGWFLLNKNDKMADLLQTLESEPLDLEKTGKILNLTPKRVFIALSEHTDKNSQVILLRSDKTVFSERYLTKIWQDALITVDFEEDEPFEKVFQKIIIDSRHRKFLNEKIRDWLKEQKSEVVVGSDGILRRKSDVVLLLEQFISDQWTADVKEITYGAIGDNFGITSGEIGNMITQMMDQGKLTDSTIYPVDELIKPRIQ